MSEYISGADRQQAWMLPETVEDYVSEDNPVRFIDAFVEGLDRRQVSCLEQPAATGRPGYAPADLLKLYLYGYLNRVRSSRELERLTQRNLEVIWLMRRLSPDHKTISEFRRAHRASFKEVFRQFNLLCRELKLFGAELVAIDGSIFKAVNSKARNFTLDKLRGLLGVVDRGIENYLKELELGDQPGESGAAGAGGTRERGAKDLAGKLEELRGAKQRYEQMLRQLEDSGQTQISLTDPEARLMKKSTSKDSVVGYNVQSVVDGAHHLIVEVEATQQGQDYGQLCRMGQQAQAMLQTQQLTVVADAGYGLLNDLKAAEEAGLRVHVPLPPDKMERAGFYGREQFVYHQEQDTYECPGHQQLVRHADSRQDHKVYAVYYHTAACARCALRARCTSGAYRKIKRLEHPEVFAAIRQRLQASPEVFAQRKALVEHPFGTLKFWRGQGAFLTRGCAAVNAEISLSALAYNITRAIKVLGVRALLACARQLRPCLA